MRELAATFGRKSVTLRCHAILILHSMVGMCSYCSGEIVGAYVLPHGGIALDPSHFNTTNQTALKEAWVLHDAAVRIGDAITKHKPDLIFLSTPHGIADLSRFVLYLNPTGFGTADTDNCKCPPCCYNVSINMDSKLALTLARDLQLNNVSASGLSAFGPPGGAGEDFPLRWGEVVPLCFLGDLESTKVVILSQPSRRYEQSVEMIPELIELGSKLGGILSSTDRRVVVIISADLAHTHDKDGPYGFSNAAEPFDKACGLWASSLDANVLLRTAAGYVEKALSCGYTGLVMLHGLLTAVGVHNWAPTLYANYHPSYYGMMVASFERNQ